MSNLILSNTWVGTQLPPLVSYHTFIAWFQCPTKNMMKVLERIIKKNSLFWLISKHQNPKSFSTMAKIQNLEYHKTFSFSNTCGDPGWENLEPPFSDPHSLCYGRWSPNWLIFRLTARLLVWWTSKLCSLVFFRILFGFFSFFWGEGEGYQVHQNPQSYHIIILFPRISERMCSLCST